jgi:hypothetical protein
MAARIPASVDGKLFGLYLSDHLTGATAGVGRIERMAREFEDTPVRAELADVSSQIRRERDFLRALIQDLGLRQRPYRQAASWLAERAGRLKLNGRVFARSPMTMVLEAELMRAAVMGKLGGWQTLQELAGDLGLDQARFTDLIRDAHAQIAALDRVHEHARINAFRNGHDVGA